MSWRTNINATIIIKSWFYLTNDLSEDYHGQWICDESWFWIMNDKYSHLDGAYKQKHVAQYLPQIVGKFSIQIW